jgi:hypothetical protein
MKLRFLQLLLLFLLTGVLSDVSAQGAEIINVIKNEAKTYSFFSRFQPALGRNPSHGTARIAADGNLALTWVLTYTPDQDYVGQDGMLLVSFPLGFNVGFTEFSITVAEADIRARHDFAATQTGAPVTIDVMANDSVNVGGIRLFSVPVANAGVGEVINGQVVFTPNAGFVGLTDFNYLVCSDYDACALGTVTVNVLPDGTTTAPDTVRVFTKRNEAQFIFAPTDAVPTATPQSGSMVDRNGVMAYQPDEDFVGDEFLTYTSAGSAAATVYHVTVLDIETNFFAVEDRAYTAIDRPIRLNVLHNDVYDIFADCVSFGAPQFGSLRETNRKGEVIYTPPAAWSGVDKFSYSSMSPGCAGEAEQQTVYVFVSNFAPAAEEATLTTPAGTPVALTYEATGGAATWSVVTPPSNGSIITDPLTGQLSYLPLLTAAGQTDEVTIKYCLNADAAGNCGFSTEVTVRIQISAEDANACIDEDCVWPGDTNNDGVVDVGDLLAIGQAMGATGTPRLSANNAGWSAQYAEDWSADLNGLNLKHIDANGDQIISHLDTQVVMQNLGLQHRLRPAQIDFTPFELSLVGPLEAEPGDLVSLEIVAGNFDVVIIDLAGFRFPFNYDNTTIDAASVDITIDESGWISYDSPILTISSNDAGAGRLDAAVTRTSGRAVSGYGRVGKMDVVIIDLAGFRAAPGENEETRVGDFVTELGGGENATFINSAGHLSAVHVNPHQLTIKRQAATDASRFEPTVANEYLDGKLLAYPNPTSGNLTVHLNGQQRFSALQLTDLTGRIVRSEQGLDTNHRELTLGDLPNGMYLLMLTTTDGVVNRKIEVMR